MIARLLLAPSLAPSLLLAAACGGEPEAPRPSETTGGSESAPAEQAEPEPPPPLPDPIEGTFALPVRVPLSTIGELIDSQLPDHDAEGYKPMTRAGKSPAIEARYEFWRDPVEVRFRDSTLAVVVPVRYAARFNARIKNPFGGKWMTVARDEPWGTKHDPLRVTLTLRTRIRISRDWKLSLHTKVERPRHGTPPQGKICTGGAFKLCVTKASLAPQVQKRMDAELVGRIQKAAADFDRRAVRIVALRRRVEQVFGKLMRPIPADHGRWMVLEPRGAALSLRADGDAVVAEPALEARLSHHEHRPGRRSPVLPDKRALSELSAQRLALPDAFTPPEVRALLP